MTTTIAEPTTPATPSPTVNRLPGLGTFVTIAVWLGLVGLAVAGGAFEGAGDPPLALMTAVAGPLAAFAVAYGMSVRFKGFVRTLDLRLVLAAQLWRVVGAGFLLALAFDRLPAGFAIPAGVGDIATGLAALTVVVALARGTLTKAGLYAFSALGIGDFLVAVVTGLAMRPVEMDLWPLILFPTVAVPFFAVLHVVALIQARHGWADRIEALGGR